MVYYGNKTIEREAEEVRICKGNWKISPAKALLSQMEKQEFTGEYVSSWSRVAWESQWRS